MPRSCGQYEPYCMRTGARARIRRTDLRCRRDLTSGTAHGLILSATTPTAFPYLHKADSGRFGMIPAPLLTMQ